MTPYQLAKSMADGGASLDLVLIALKALEEQQAELSAKVARPRSTAALRQQRYRDKKKSEETGVVTGDDVTRDANRYAESDAANVTNDVRPSLSLSPNENNSNPHTHTHPDNTSRASGPWDAHVSAWVEWREKHPFPKPWWAEANVWRDFKANRKAKRLTNTVTAHTKFLRDISALVTPEWPPGRLLEAIVARGWAAAYDPRPKGANNDRSDRTRNSSRYQPDGAMDYLQRDFGIGPDYGASGPSGRWDDGEPEGGDLLPYS